MDVELNLYKEIDISNDNIIFYIKNSKISKTSKNEFISKLKDGESEYISLIEGLPFSSIGKENININKDDIYIIDFLGNTDNLKVELFIISYSQQMKLKVESVELGNRLYFYPHEDTKSMRLAIKVSGYGNFKIDDIKIYKQKVERFKSYEEIDALKIDKPKELKDLRVACIFDEFTMNCFKDMVDTIPLTPYNWKLEVSLKKPHILIVESAWEGKDKLWLRKIANRDINCLSILQELTSWCKTNNIPTIFWNKEDPVHFNAFINACKYFDYIFTTDEGSIENYKITLGHDRVYAMPFACQPKIHNPIKFYNERINKACFAGTYYGNRFRERKKDTDNILNASIETIGLDIFDRKLYTKNTPYKFPTQYENYIKGCLKADELELANKGYKVTLNVNSVKNSKTMFSRRVFESIASATPVVSSYSIGIKNIFNDLVFCSDNFEELKNELEKLKNDENYYNRKVIQGIRLCMSKHTYQNRLEFILDKANIDLGIKSESVGLVCIIDNYEKLKTIEEIYNIQTYENKKLILIFKDENLFNKVDLINLNNSQKILYNKNLIIKEVLDTDYISVINTNNFYGKYYIQDLMNATKYCEAEFIGKKSYYKKNKLFRSFGIENSSKEFEYVQSLDLDKCIFKCKTLRSSNISEFMNYINLNCIDKFSLGYRYFSIDKYNLVEGYSNLTDFELDIVEI